VEGKFVKINRAFQPENLKGKENLSYLKAAPHRSRTINVNLKEIVSPQKP
jgi:hypothetical protein